MGSPPVTLQEAPALAIAVMVLLAVGLVLIVWRVARRWAALAAGVTVPAIAIAPWGFFEQRLVVSEAAGLFAPVGSRRATSSVRGFKGEELVHRADFGRGTCELETSWGVTARGAPRRRGDVVSCDGFCMRRADMDRGWFRLKDGADPAPRVYVEAPFESYGNRLRSLAPVLSPPAWWLGCALIGALAAAAILARRDRALERRRAWIESERDGEPVLVAPHATEGGAYRAPARIDPALVMPGTRATLAARIAEAAAGRWFLALVVLLLTMAPVVVAMILGFAT
jgi:hypothetical protein